MRCRKSVSRMLGPVAQLLRPLPHSLLNPCRDTLCQAMAARWIFLSVVVAAGALTAWHDISYWQPGEALANAEISNVGERGNCPDEIYGPQKSSHCTVIQIKTSRGLTRALYLELAWMESAPVLGQTGLRQWQDNALPVVRGDSAWNAYGLRYLLWLVMAALPLWDWRRKRCAAM